MRTLQRSKRHLFKLFRVLLIILLCLELLKSQWRLKYDAKSYRIRCQGYILNLCTQSFLFVTDRENIEELSDSTNKYDITLAEINKWRKQGPLGMLHNLVVYIQQSVQREQKFWELSGDLRLTRNNDTRWKDGFINSEWLVLRITDF